MERTHYAVSQVFTLAACHFPIDSKILSLVYKAVMAYLSDLLALSGPVRPDQ